MANQSYRYVSGVAELTKRLRELPTKIANRHLRGAMLAGAKVIKEEAIAKAPERTGRLKANIIVQFKGKESVPGKRVVYHLTVRNGPTRRYTDNRRNRQRSRVGKTYVLEGSAFYWRFVEFGTAYMQAQPFMRSAFEAKKNAAVEAIAAKLRTGINREKWGT